MPIVGMPVAYTVYVCVSAIFILKKIATLDVFIVFQKPTVRFLKKTVSISNKNIQKHQNYTNMWCINGCLLKALMPPGLLLNKLYDDR